MARPKRVPTCHPDREHKANDLCQACYDATPERRAKARACRTAYYATPEGKGKVQAYSSTPEVKAKKKARRATPENKAKTKVYRSAYFATPEGKANQKAYNATYRTTPEGRAKLFILKRKSAGHPVDATVEEVMAVQTQTVCKICGASPKKRALHTDHCHVTRKLRGLLCARCNNRAAHLDAIKHDKDLADRWAAYL